MSQTAQITKCLFDLKNDKCYIFCNNDGIISEQCDQIATEKIKVKNI